MDSPFLGIFEKLERADENVRNLDVEVTRFFDESDYPTIPQNDDELRLKAITYHKNRRIPLRFSVLAGEIIHHLRSSLDHVAWQLSSVTYRRNFPNRIEFPILDTKPCTRDELARYERKIKGILNPKARIKIEELQPYNSPDPLDSPLLLIHQMDIFDKHRELVTCFTSGTAYVHADILRQYMQERSVDLATAIAQIPTEIRLHSKVVPQVSFRNFGRRKVKAIVPALMQLSNHVRDVIGLLSEFE